MARKEVDVASWSQSESMFIGIIGPLIAQAAITFVLGLVTKTMPNQDALGPLLLASCALMSGAGFCVMVRDCSPAESVLVAIGYFPLMALGFCITGLLILMSLPGATGNF